MLLFGHYLNNKLISVPLKNEDQYKNNRIMCLNRVQAEALGSAVTSTHHIWLLTDVASRCYISDSRHGGGV